MSQGEGQSRVIFPLAKQTCMEEQVVFVHVRACACASVPGHFDHYK